MLVRWVRCQDADMEVRAEGIGYLLIRSGWGIGSSWFGT